MMCKTSIVILGCMDDVKVSLDMVYETVAAAKDLCTLWGHMENYTEQITRCPVFGAIMEEAEFEYITDLERLECQAAKSVDRTMAKMHYLLVCSMLRELRMQGRTDEVFCTSAFTEEEIHKFSADCQLEVSEAHRARLLDPLYCRRRGGCLRPSCQIVRRPAISLNWAPTALPKVALVPGRAFISM